MQKNRANTLMFQLGMCFSVILIGALLLVITSWRFTKQESESSASIAALSDPYAQMYASIDALSTPIRNMKYQNDMELDVRDQQILMQNMKAASNTLMVLLNGDEYNRASVDMYNTMDGYLEDYRAILSSYSLQDYAGVNNAIEQLTIKEKWIRSYLVEIGECISQKQASVQKHSEQMRVWYYRSVLIHSCIILLLCFFTLAIAAKRFVAPIRVLCKAVKDFRLSDSIEALQARGIPCRKNSLQEIRTLATAIYSMQDTVLSQYVVEKNNELLRNKLKEEELHTIQIEKQLQETQLMALQAQINPHFLFNTLNIIAQMSYIEGAEQTTELLEIFSNYFRYNVENFEKNVTLAEEIDNVRGYIALQRARFGERIQYHIEADEDINDFLVPCLVIQPLVENAISHGLRMKTENGEVRVLVKKLIDDGFIIEVSDNGCGMDKHTLQELLEKSGNPGKDESAKHKSIGVSNVVNRMKIAFGNRLSFQIYSAPDAGTTIQLCIEGRCKG